MNLTKLFNFDYLKQNLKKSKVILSIFTCLIPILNTIILIMYINNNRNSVFNFHEISLLNYVGIYILPIIVSICLFNYIYKKKSVDFINSMPISRKSIFVTNTIIGIILILSMLIVNAILILLLSLIFNNVYVPFSMIIDYLWYFLVIYIFAFSATNVAMSISGNAITQVVVTLLLFFLIPFVSSFTTLLHEENLYSNVLLECTDSTCLPKQYYCYNDTLCNINKEANLYEFDAYRVVKNNYTALYGIPYTLLTDNEVSINYISVIKMIILSILYMFIGYRLFLNRKMEVSETTFKNKHIHNIVKSLTLIPFIAISYIVGKDNMTAIVFSVVIMIVYFFIYDLITKKSITDIKLSIIYFISTVCLFTIIFSICDIEREDKDIIKYNDIDSVAISLFDSYNNYNDKIYVKDKQLISLIVKNNYNYRYENYNSRTYISYIKLNNNKEYQLYSYLDEEDYNKMIDILSNTKEYVDNYKNINFDKVYAVSIGNKAYSKSESKNIVSLVKDTLNKLSLKEFIELQKKYRGISSNSITLYMYENNTQKTFTVSGYINYNLLNSIVNSNNSLLSENMSNVLPDYYEIYYTDSYLKDEYYSIDYYVLKNCKKEIYNFILNNINKQVDMKKEYITLEIYLDDTDYYFTTNNVNGLIDILDNKYIELKDTEEYIDYYNYGDVYEY